MGIPLRNTDYVNNPIGNDRPIYGNEKLPPSPTPTTSVTPSPTPNWNYYEVQSCSTAFVGYIRTTNTLSIGSSVYSSVEGCLEVFATATTETELTEFTTEYVSCASCESSVTPTPTPTYSPTPTISLTPSVSITPSITPSVSVSETPGASPTPTPTPSTSGYVYIYDTFNCDDALDTRRFASNSFIAVGKVIKGVTLTECYEVTGESEYGIYDDVVNLTYLDCGSCPR